MNEKLTSNYLWWKASLAGKNPPTHPDKPQCGRFLLRGLPAAIWVNNDGIMLLRIGSAEDGVDTEGVESIALYWSQLCKNPIPEDEYKARVAGTWSAPQSNNPPADNTPEGILEQIKSALSAAIKTSAVTDEETAKAVTGQRNRLLELAGTVTKLHAAEKEPFLIGGKRVDAKWFPARDLAKEEADRLRLMLSAYETEKDRKRKAWVEEERKKAIANNRAVEETVDLGAEPEKPTRKANYGKNASVRERITITSVADWDSIYRRYCLVPEVQELLTKLIIRDIGRGETIPGVEVERTKDVR